MVDHFFHPDGVAVIGATENKAKGGYFLLRNVLAGYKGRVYPVNPKYEKIQGVTCYPDVDSIPENFDLALYFIPSKFLPDTIEACAGKGVKGIIIESAGFSEVGDEGRLLQEHSVALAEKYGIRLWGPNCMGLLDGHSRNVFSFMYSDRWIELMKPGTVALIVQSGMLSAGFLLMVLEQYSMGISKISSIGNKCDIDETDLLEYLIQDSDTAIIGCYLESIKKGSRFIELAKGTEKPIVVLKSGRSPGGAQAAMSHTASLSGESAVYTGAFRQAGIVQVYDLHEMMDFVRGFSKTPVCRCDGGTGVITFSGGAGIVTADLLHDNGVRMADLSGETLKDIEALFPEWMKASHPVDLWPAVEAKGLEPVYTHVTECMLKDPDVDSLLVETIAWGLSKTEFIAKIAELKQKYNKPVVVWMVGGREAYDAFTSLAEEKGLPVFWEIGRCAAFLRGIKGHFHKKRALGLI